MVPGQPFDHRIIDTYETILAALPTLQDADVWIGACPLRGHPSRGRGDREDIDEVHTLWADIDWQHPTRRTQDPLPTEAEVRAAVARLGQNVKPSIIVNSGHGLQLWWLLRVPVKPDEAEALIDQLDASLANVGLANGRSDLPSIMRLPGTQNHKDPDDLKPVTIESIDTAVLYTPEWLQKYLLTPAAGNGSRKTGGRTRHHKSSLTPDQQDLTNLVVGNFGGHSPDVWSDGSIHLVRPGKTARQGSGASIIIGDDGDAILTVFTDHWPNLAQGSYVLSDGKLVHPSSTAAQLQGITINVQQPPLVVDSQQDDLYEAGALNGATFILDQPSILIARWGKGADVLWAQGESIMLCGPTGVGKTTIAGQLVAGLIGILPDVLGYPVLPAKRVLYLAMDRPRQIQRAFQRLFGPQHRQALSEHLTVRRGPLPQDLNQRPAILAEIAKHFDADVLILDSLKDAAVQITDDRVAGNVNRAIQYCNVADVDVALLHHQRKSVEGRKPTTLEDVYGNTQITAGAGSVLLLWGDAGSELVELTHLKQPAEVVGPYTVEHDHHRGTSKVTHGWDALAYLRMKGAAGATIAEATQAHHGAPQTAGQNKWKQTERKLRSLVERGEATKTSQAAVGATTRYYAIITQSPQAAPAPAPRGQPRGPSVKTDTVDPPVDDPVDIFTDDYKTPGQAVDSNVDTD